MTELEMNDVIGALREEMKSQRRWLRWSIRAWVALVLLLCLGAASQQAPELRVSRLALVDENGVERLILANDHKDIRVNGKVYQRRSPATGIILQNTAGDETGGMVMLDDGTASVTLDGYSEYGANERASMFVMPDGSSGFLVKDPKGQVRASLQVTPEMESSFRLLGENEKRGAYVTVKRSGTRVSNF